MRIAVLTRYIHDAGGVEAYLRSVVPAIVALGNEVAVWHEFSRPAGREGYLGSSIPTRHLAPQHIDRAISELGEWKPDVLFLNGLSVPSVEMRLTSAQPTVTFLHGYHGACISGSKTRAFPAPSPCGRPLGPGCLLQYYPRRCGGLNPVVMVDSYREQRLRQRLLKRSTFVATFSEHMRREAISNGVDEARAVHLPAFNPAWPLASEPAFGTGNPSARFATRGPWHVAFVGRMERLKGAHVLMEAVGLLDRDLRSRLRVTFAGDGRERLQLERAAARISDVSIDFPGWIDGSRRDELFRTLDLLVVPSIWPEPLGLIGLEAAAAGVPAVAFDVGGIGDWLEDGTTGRLVRGTPPSSRALAAAITDSLSDMKRLREWAAHALDTARHRTVRAHVDALDTIFKRAAEYHSRCPIK